MDTLHISPGNAKTGDEWSFDIPAIETCPGRSELCASKCYAAQLMRVYKNVDAKYQRNLSLARSFDFVTYMVDTIPANVSFRIHVSGDFYSVQYIQDWIDIATNRPDVEFYAYTRSWRQGASFNKQIIALNSLTNVNVNLSCDTETGKPNFLAAPRFRWAYLTHEKGYDDAPNWLRRGDIVFRSASAGHKKRRKNAVKRGDDPNVVAPLVNRIGEAPVCPFERGRDVDNFSCSKCRICIDKPRVAEVSIA